MSGFELGLLCGVGLALVPVAILCVILDRRDERRRRMTLRIDQTPAPLPGAYAPPARRALTSSRTGVVILDGDPDPADDPDGARPAE